MQLGRVLVSVILCCVQVSYGSVKPHILFIVADDLGWNDVSWNNPGIIMPTLDKMARKGVILNSSYVQPICSPSRGAFMTGYFPYHLGMQHGVMSPYQPKFLPRDKKTLPESLQDIGYKTHLVGKWHLGFCNWNDTPTYRGFDSFYGFYTGAQDYYRHTHYGGYDFRFNTSIHQPHKGRYSTTLFAERAAEIVEQHNPEESPLFLYLSFQGVHSPLQAPRRYIRKYKHIANKNRRIYNGMITAMDEAVGKVMTAMDRYNLIDNLLVVFTSDNGAASYIAGSNWPLRGSKTTLWEGGTRVPAFVYSKSMLKKTGIVSNGLFHAVDWYPTLLKVAGGITDPWIDGVDQWQMLSRAWPSSRSEFVYNIDESRGDAAIRVGDYKLIVGNAGKYNGWYQEASKPSCRRRSGYGYQKEARQIQKDDQEQEKGDTSGWLFAGSLKKVRNYIYRKAASSGVLGVWRRLGRLYADYRCDRFMYAHKQEQRRLRPDPIQLYNLEDDPTERYNLATRKPVLLKKMLKRLRTYKRSLVPSKHPPADKMADPKHFDGVWSPGWC